jgi:hypothetical protein
MLDQSLVIDGYDIRKSELFFILFQVTLKVLKIYFLKNIKCYMMSSYMTKLEFSL